MFSNMKIHKIAFILVLTFVYIEGLFSQKENGYRIISGECKMIINSLIEYQSSDSIAVEIFKREYIIENMPKQEKILEKRFVEIINFFNSKEGEKYKCHLKEMEMPSPLLLVN